MRIEDIRAGYPDCTAIGKSGRRIEIEFEYESSRFNHPDDPAGKLCDWVVCWIDNAKKGEKWRKNVKVKELSSLSRFSDLGPKVWIQPYQPANVERLIGYRRHTAWTVPSEARKGDLLLVYRSGRPAAITHIMVLLTTAEFDRRHSWGRGFAANLKTVAELPTPLTRAACLERPELRDVSFFKRPTQLGQDVLSHWPAIRVALLTSNRGSGLKSVLAPYRLTTKTGRIALARRSIAPPACSSL